MAEKCIALMKMQKGPKIIDEQQSSVTTDLITEVKTAINLDDKNAYNAKTLLNCREAAEIKSVKTLLVSKTTAHKPINDTTKISPMQAEGKKYDQNVN